MPSFPAFVLLLAAIPLLVPTLGKALRGERFRAAVTRPPSLRVVAAAAAAFVLVPFVLVVGASALSGPRAVKYFAQNVFVPLDRFDVTTQRTGGAVSISWPSQGDSATNVFYRVLRMPALAQDPENQSNPLLVDGVNCLRRRSGAADCRLKMETIAVTRGAGFVDRPAPGKWSYRVGVSANWLDDADLGDVVLVSRPATVTIAS